MPEWLLKKDEYIPDKDKDTFINKSILSLLRIISSLIIKSDGKRNIFKINAVLKVISVLLIIVLLSVSRSFFFVLTLNVLLLLVVSLLNADEIKNIIGVSFIMALFTFVILIPSMIYGNTENSILIILKVLGTITTVNVLSHVSEWNEITGTLKLFFVPDIFIFVFDITVKYIIVLGEFSLSLLYALKLRSVGKSKNKYASLSGIMGTMFIKSKEMAEEMHSAMECRGFTGEYTVHYKLKFGIKDYLFILINIMIIIIYIFFR